MVHGLIRWQAWAGPRHRADGFELPEANRPALRIDLIDGELLAEKLKELGLGVRKKMVEPVGIDEEWFASV